jgi:hypothetical protein
LLNPGHQCLVVQNDIHELGVMRRQLEKFKEKHDKYYQKLAIKIHDVNYKEIFEVNQNIRTFRKLAFIVTYDGKNSLDGVLLNGIIVSKIPHTLEWLHNYISARANFTRVELYPDDYERHINNFLPRKHNSNRHIDDGEYGNGLNMYFDDR